MESRSDSPEEADRLPYEPPRVEEELEFETAALATCGKTGNQTPACTSNPPTS
jgi:hypothetical protein